LGRSTSTSIHAFCRQKPIFKHSELIVSAGTRDNRAVRARGASSVLPPFAARA